MSGSTFTVRLLGATAAVLLASACGGTTVSPTAATTPAVTTSPAAMSPTKATMPGGALSVATTSLGSVLVDSKGMTVYLLSADTPRRSSCTAQCLKFWPAVPGPTGAAAGKMSGVMAAMGVTKTTGGASMLTAGGRPLYTFVKDKAPGDVNGEGKTAFGGTWFAVSPSGTPIKATAKIAPTTPTAAAHGY